MSDIRSIINEISRNALLTSNSLSASDELALVRQASKALSTREGDLKQIVLADRENRVGAEYYVSVTERAGSVSWKKVAEELHEKLCAADDCWCYTDMDALEAKYVGKSSEVVAVDKLPDLDLINEAYMKGFVVLDFETTGLSTATSLPVSIGLVRVDRSGDLTTLYKVVNPGIPIPPATTAIHGITDAYAANGIAVDEAAWCVVDMMDNCDTKILVGQNLFSFDLPILQRLLPKGADKGWRFLDTRLMAKQAWPGGSASADAISARLGIEARMGVHNALSDAAMTASHFNSIAELLLDRGIRWT